MGLLERKNIAILYNGEKLHVSMLTARRSSEWIVGLHGVQSDKSLYEGFFAQSFTADYSLLAIDFIGFGDSDKPDNFSYDLKDQAAIVLLILDRLDVGRIHLVGHSLGGMVGILLLDMLGERVVSFANLEGNLVLADCGTSKQVATYSLKEFEATGYDQLRMQISQSSEASAAARSRWLRQIPAAVFYKSSMSILAWSKSGKLQTMFNNATIRRLFMYGDQNVHKAEIVSAAVTKVSVTGAGHFMLLDQPNACYRSLQEFISKKAS